MFFNIFKRKNFNHAVASSKDKPVSDLSIYIPIVKYTSYDTSSDLSFSDRLYLSLKGCALGDFAGQPYEFTPLDECKDITQDELYKFAKDTTDDTILTCATAQALCMKFDDPNIGSTIFGDLYRKYAKQYPSPLGGYGSRFLAWVYTGIDPQSCGNGSAMRVSPCGCLDNVEDVIKAAYESAICTHNHPEGIKGAIVVAVCIWMAFHGCSKEDIGNYASQMYAESPYSPALKWSKLKSYKQAQGNTAVCQTTVPMAISCFVNSTNFEDCILKAVQFGWDTDTQAAIAGSIAGAYYKRFDDLSNCKWEEIKETPYIKSILALNV